MEQLMSRSVLPATLRSYAEKHKGISTGFTDLLDEAYDVAMGELRSKQHGEFGRSFFFKGDETALDKEIKNYTIPSGAEWNRRNVFTEWVSGEAHGVMHRTILVHDGSDEAVRCAFSGSDERALGRVLEHVTSFWTNPNESGEAHAPSVEAVAAVAAVHDDVSPKRSAAEDSIESSSQCSLTRKFGEMKTSF